ncbi:MAG: methyltransferase domain-containing protein [Burkholderiales bacterium]|nr:methyltransferase domain-containing protein [Burkholderiales bacterium]
MYNKTIAENRPSANHERIASRCPCCNGTDLLRSPAIIMPFVADRVFNWKPTRIDDSWGLKTISNGNAYALCNSMHCQGCGFLFLDVRFSESEMEKLYSGYRDAAYCQLRELYEPGYQLRNDSLNQGVAYIKDIESFLEPHLRFPARILDWGGDTGKNTPYKEKNSLWHIYDISNKSAVAGAQVVNKATVDSTEYNLIVCSNVFEHIPQPRELLQDIREQMWNDTILYIEVPFEDIARTAIENENLASKKRHWHEHITFSP